MAKHKGVSATILPSARIEATARFRVTLAVQHLLAAARFARACWGIEQQNTGKPLGPFYYEILSCVSAGVLSAVAAMEANLNELLADHPRFGTAVAIAVN